ncbi:Alkyl transferase [Heracleum sosnowskyi]|uniref:Alkyl transferase n=1 Tax=Heracleum sosnowskyi TaxID=360622 RepID=A0AAD8JKP7_9APIA|nr:Alkyl transferase [Heracleum sosnowskyi]
MQTDQLENVDNGSQLESTNNNQSSGSTSQSHRGFSVTPLSQRLQTPQSQNMSTSRSQSSGSGELNAYIEQSELDDTYDDLSRLCWKCGIKVLTTFLFSYDNWKRSQEDIDRVMIMFEEEMISNLQESMRHDIRISVIGDRTRLLKSLIEVITEAEEKIEANSRLHLILAIGYSGQSDILQASCKKLCRKVRDGLIRGEDINKNIFEQELGKNVCTQFPFPDLLIRTGGDLRLSNFMAYQSAYAELYFTKTFSPDFGEEEFIMVLKSFQERHRRYGV